MGEDIKVIRDEAHKSHTEFLVFQTKIETTLEQLDPRELSAQLKGLSNFETKLNTLISVGKWWGGILTVFALGLSVTLVTAATKLSSALGSQTTEIAHLGKLLDRTADHLDRIEKALPAKGVEDGLATTASRLGVLDGMAKDMKSLTVRDAAARSFDFTLTRDNLVDAAKGVRFRVTLDPDEASRYGKIASAFPDHTTKVALRRLSPGLRTESVADEDFFHRFSEAVSVSAEVLQGGAVFTFEPRTDAGAEILKNFARNMAEKQGESVRLSFKVYL